MGVRGVEPVELGPGYERGVVGSFSVLSEQVGGPVVNDEGFDVEVPLRGGKGLLVRIRDGEVFDGAGPAVVVERLSEHVDAQVAPRIAVVADVAQVEHAILHRDVLVVDVGGGPELDAGPH